MKQPRRSVGSGTTSAGLPTPRLKNNASGTQVVHENVFAVPSELSDCKGKP